MTDPSCGESGVELDRRDLRLLYFGRDADDCPAAIAPLAGSALERRYRVERLVAVRPDGPPAPSPPDHLFTDLPARIARTVSLPGWAGAAYERAVAACLGIPGNALAEAATLEPQVVASDPALVLLSPRLSRRQATLAAAAALRARRPWLSWQRLAARTSALDYFAHEIEPVVRRVRKRERLRTLDSLADIYGAREVVGRYCGLDPAAFRFPGHWMHGWIPAYHAVHPAFVALAKPVRRTFGWLAAADRLNRNAMQLVARTDQAAYLRAHGFASVRAVGLPMVYVPAPGVVRRSGSLLVMPPHGHHARDPENALVNAYVAAVLDQRRNFEHIALCVSNDDYIRRQWWPAFAAHGVEIVIGAEPTEPSSVGRLRALLGRFEYVTTNGFGSHIAYAAYCGAKVSVFGPFAEPDPKMIAGIHAVRMVPQLRALQQELCSERALRAAYPELFVDPAAAIERREWGASEIGADCRLTPQDWRGLLIADPRRAEGRPEGEHR